MKRHHLLFSTFLLFFLAQGTVFGEEVIVRTKTGQIRSQNRFYAPIVLTVSFEDRLEVISEQGDWFNVKFDGKEGWIHSSAVNLKKPKELRPVLLGAEMAPEEADEVTLAGKGFNPQVEKDMQKKHAELDFSKVDQIESRTPDGKKLETFIREGGLNTPEYTPKR